MRVAIVTESFLPTRNGVTTSVCRVTEELTARGHDVSIVAPGPAPRLYAGAEVHALGAVTVREFPVGVPSHRVESLLRGIAPDVVHLASPFVVGARGLHAALSLGVPTVAVYQTDMPAYLCEHVHPMLGRWAGQAAWRWIRRLHNGVDVTLAPSHAARSELRAHGVQRVALWGRGVDTALHSPQRRRSERVQDLRRRIAPGGEVIIGYVGRLAPEKEVHRLADIARFDGVKVVVVGDGPSRRDLERLLPGALFTGFLDGTDLADAYATFDIFVHTGTSETFGQTLQEAAATGLPVVAPAVGGPTDLVQHSETGYLFDPSRPGQLKAFVRRLIADAELRSSMGAAGRSAVHGRSWGALTEQLLDHYRFAMARAQGPTHRVGSDR